MKICPRCQKTYTDDNLNFCLDDGVVLQQTSGNEPPATVLMNQPPATDPRASVQAPPTMQSQQPAWNTAPQQFGAAPAKKSSKTWVWVLLILGVLIIGCGTLSVVGLYFIGKSAENSTANNTATTNTKTNSSNTKVTFPSNTSGTTMSNTTTANTASTDGRNNTEAVELSDLVMENSQYGNTAADNDELTMSSKKNDSYYVIVTKGMGYVTDGADTRVTLKNRDNQNTPLGYGLVFHSNQTPLTQDYAFLLDTKKKRYRLVRHTPGDETPVIPWTSSNAIHDGAQENTIEVRDKPSDDKFELYINGQLVNTVPNTYGYKGGVPGLYTGGTAPIVFKNFQLSK
jgi:hypothetical protein